MLKGLEYTYRPWLGCLSKHHPQLLALPPAQRATQETVLTFIACLRQSCSDMTVSVHLQRLYLVLRDMDQGADLQWLWNWSHSLFKTCQPRERVHASGKQIRALGVQMMQEARQRAYDYGYISIWTARMYRKGLELVFFSVLGERRRAVQGLRLGEHLVRRGGRWWLKLTPDLTKEKKWSEKRLPENLSAWIDDYVERFRPAMPGATEHDGFLAAGSGRPMHANTILQSVTRTTKAKLGKSVSPLDLRRSIATERKRRGLDYVADARLHLNHASETITLNHYAERKMVVGNALTKALGDLGDLPKADQT